MTDTTIAPEAGPDAPPDTTPTAPSSAPVSQPAPAPEAVDHTPGGWPVVPLAVTGTNTTTTLLAAAALVGGPAALAVAATGTVVLGAAAAAARNRSNHNDRTMKNKSAKTRAAGATGGLRHGSASAGGRVPRQPARSRSGGTASPGALAQRRGRGAPPWCCRYRVARFYGHRSQPKARERCDVCWWHGVWAGGAGQGAA
ncbi:hypothetical protein [Streptomyces sp. NPDC090029]|uniref:hypothetical protein n=1 Tax=Streptomyces sp. NPDC090029 TaxID=3365924 RepID=UPI00380D7BC5